MNTLLLTDTYKLLHSEQYPEDTTEVYSYLEARKGDRTVFFGLQYILLKYLTDPVTYENVKEFLEIYEHTIGKPSAKQRFRFHSLAELGYWPVKIMAVPEGCIVNSKNVLMTIVNTHPDFAWCVGFLESLILKVWNPCTVATASFKYKLLVEKFAHETCDNLDHLPYSVHDFGYRGCSSEETAAISGASHLLNFLGSDTIPAVNLLKKYYYPNAKTQLAASVPASEHSVMCSYGREGEFTAFDRMLELYPAGIVSIVSDTYNLWNVLESYTRTRLEKILSREGKVVFRPDSGSPVKIICGDPESDSVSARRGALQTLWDIFGGTINSKGFKVLNPHVGLIYGDGMYYERFEEMLKTMRDLGFASSNLVIGIGGLLLQQHNRDEFGFAIKASRIIRGGKEIEIFKDPITDPGKKSKKGLMYLTKKDGRYFTHDQQHSDLLDTGYLKTVFVDGILYRVYTVESIRRLIDEERK